MGKKKVCYITNAPGSYLLEIDGRIIPFYGTGSADFFEQHFKDLGYTVTRKTLEQ